MPEYNYIDEGIKGMPYGLSTPAEKETWRCEEANGIDFGAPIFGYVGDDVGGWNFHNDTAKIVYDVDFIADNSTVITVNGEAADAVVYTTTHDNTMDLLVVAVSALDGVKAVLDAEDVNNRTILIQTKGLDNTSSSVTTGGASQPTPTVTYGSSQVFVGVSVFSQKIPGGYEETADMPVMIRGNIRIEAFAAVLANNEAYILDTGDIGEFGASGIEVDARYRSNASSGNLARLEINGQTEMAYAGLFA
jgi:hypothetical protein